MKMASDPRPHHTHPFQPRYWLLLMVAFLGLACVGRQASAAEDDFSARYYVIAIEGDRIFVDMGRKDGLIDNQVLQVFRTNVTFDHPVTQQKLVGTTYLGDLQIAEVSDAFSIAKSQASLLPQIKPGYEVRFRPQDLSEVRSNRARLRELASELAIDQETWEQRVVREMVRYNNTNNRIATSVETVYFDKLDTYTRLRTDFTYRLFRGLYAVRFGVGSINGIDAKRDETTETLKPYPVAFYYGYTELEFRIAPYFSVMPSVQLGLNNSGVGYGGGASVRIGPELGTNLVLTGSGENAVGSHFALSYQHFINPVLALSGMAAWENYVRGDDSDPSVRVLLGLHWQVLERLQLDLRAGVGGRDVEHIGPSVLFGLSYNFPTGLWWMQELESL